MWDKLMEGHKSEVIENEPIQYVGLIFLIKIFN